MIAPPLALNCYRNTPRKLGLTAESSRISSGVAFTFANRTVLGVNVSFPLHELPSHTPDGKNISEFLYKYFVGKIFKRKKNVSQAAFRQVLQLYLQVELS